MENRFLVLTEEVHGPQNCNVPITIKDRVWYFHSRKDQANKSKPIILTQCPESQSVTLLRTGEELSYNHKKGPSFFYSRIFESR